MSSSGTASGYSSRFRTGNAAASRPSRGVRLAGWTGPASVVLLEARLRSPPPKSPAHMICPDCHSETDAEAEACFSCGKALHVLTQGAVLAERYEIVSPLGKGGMGRVYKAYDRVLEEQVALKVLRPEFAREPDMARRFLSEIKLARKVSHPNVCRIHEYGESDG